MLKSSLLVSSFLSLPINFTHASALESALIQGVNFLNGVLEVKWYRVNRSTVIIRWKGILKLSLSNFSIILLFFSDFLRLPEIFCI
jgi:hypothetical protein